MAANEERLQLAIEGAQLGTYDWDLATNRLLPSAYFNHWNRAIDRQEARRNSWRQNYARISARHGDDF